LFIGLGNGWLEIYHINKNQTITSQKVLPSTIYSMAFTQDHSTAYMNEYYGIIKIINWKNNATCEQDFDFTENPIQVGKICTSTICLTKDDKNLLVGSEYK